MGTLQTGFSENGIVNLVRAVVSTVVQYECGEPSLGVSGLFPPMSHVMLANYQRADLIL